MPIGSDKGSFIKPGFLPLTVGPAGPTVAQAWAWGLNDLGSLGLGDTSIRSSPVQIGTEAHWASLSNGQNESMGIRTDGSLWTWGNAVTYGQLGHGNKTSLSSPVQVGTLTDWLKPAASYMAMAAIKTDGTMWTWGRNTLDGRLGLGNTTDYSSPMQVGSLTTWATLSSGYYFTLAITTGGKLYAWGYNGNGNLGDGTTTARLAPVQIGALTTWATVAAGRQFTLAIKTDGTLWTWGRGTQGQQGSGSTANRSSPVQVGALTNWLAVAGGKYYSKAVKTDGTIWCWGEGGSGQLGQNSTTDYSSPVQVGALTTWLQVGGTYNGTLAIKTDGTLWGWGRNDSGQLGDGSVSQRNSPIQIGSLTTWYEVSDSCATSSSVFGTIAQ